MRKLGLASALCAALVLDAGQALATSYPNYFGPAMSFTGIGETSATGEDPLFGAPIGIGNQLFFSPPNFAATASGEDVADNTFANLQATITATAPATTITTIILQDFGDTTLSGPTGGGFTSTAAVMSGFVTVLEVLGVPVLPTVIGFNTSTSTNGTLTPSGLGTLGNFALPLNAGTTLWQGTVSIDLASIVPNATKVQLSFNNHLQAYSEAAGNTATIQKKVVSGPAIVITVIPEPGTAALLSLGLLAISLRARGKRA